MAVDAATLIAESIDQYYTETHEPAWRADYLKWLAIKIESLDKLRAAGSLQETAEHPKDPDYRKGYKTGWAQSHRPGSGNGLPAGSSPMYQKGFEDGHGGQKKAQEFLGQYNAVQQGAGDPKAVAQTAFGFVAPHYDRMMSKASGNPDVEDNIGSWLSGDGGGGLPRSAHHTAAAFNKFNDSAHISDEEHEPINAPHPADLGGILVNRATAKKKEHIEVDKKRRAAQDREAAAARGQGHAAQTKGTVSAGSAASLQQGETAQKNMGIEHGFTHDDLLEHAYGGQEARSAHNQAITARDAGQPHESGNIIPGLEDFQKSNYHADPAQYDAMIKHAHKDWVDGISNQVLAAQQSNLHTTLKRKVNVPTGHTPHEVTGHLQRGPGTTFDPAQALISGLRDPAGFRTKGWSVRAARQQPGFENFSKARPETLESRQHRASMEAAGTPITTKKKKTAHPAAGSLDRAMNDSMKWMYDNVPSASHESPMWDFHFGGAEGFGGIRQKHAGDIDTDVGAASRTKLRPAKWDAIGKNLAPRAAETAERLRQQRANADARTYGKREWTDLALGQALSIFETWLQENVSVPEEQMSNIMEELFSRVQVSYNQLFEVEYSG